MTGIICDVYDVWYDVSAYFVSENSITFFNTGCYYNLRDFCVYMRSKWAGRNIFIFDENMPSITNNCVSRASHESKYCWMHSLCFMLSDVSHLKLSCQWYMSYLYLYLQLKLKPSSAEAVVSFGPMRSLEITGRLYKPLWGSSKPQKSMRLNLLEFTSLYKISTKYEVTNHHHGITFT